MRLRVSLLRIQTKIHGDEDRELLGERAILNLDAERELGDGLRGSLVESGTLRHARDDLGLPDRPIRTNRQRCACDEDH